MRERERERERGEERVTAAGTSFQSLNPDKEYTVLGRQDFGLLRTMFIAFST